MFQFFPNIYVILALYALAGYFYSRFEFWLKMSFEFTAVQVGKRYAKQARRNLILFSIFLVASIILTVIDCIMSVYIIE